MSIVGQITFEDAGVEYLCSGSAIATRDNSFKPYFLTAGHCINNEDAARTHRSLLDLPDFELRRRSSGQPRYQHEIDRGRAPDRFRHDRAGRLQPGSAAECSQRRDVLGLGCQPIPRSRPRLVGIHHPSGSWKRISFGERVDDATADVEGDTAPGNLYLQVLWDEGRTEPGSSGSPIFTSPGVLVGTLTYGPYSPDLSACQIDPSVSGYGRFSNAYQYLKDYLENLPAADGHARPRGLDLHRFGPHRAARPDVPADHSIHRADHLQAARRCAVDPAFDDHRQCIGGRAGAGDRDDRCVAVRPGATVCEHGDHLSGAATPQYLNVTATVSAPQSNVVEHSRRTRSTNPAGNGASRSNWPRPRAWLQG